MSIPKNHHYISQVHIKNFFNETTNKIYLFDKNKRRFFFKKTTKTIFSQNNLNTRVLENGDKDSKSIEEELNIYFEKDFKINSILIDEFINTLKISHQIYKAIIFFTKYSIIAEMRTPKYKQQLDKGIKKFFNDVYDLSSNDFNSIFHLNNEVKFTNFYEYKDIAHFNLIKMGELVFTINISKDENAYFILSDIGANIYRENINNYFNQDIKDVSYIGLPLSSKVYLEVHSNKSKLSPNFSSINYIDIDDVDIINEYNLKHCNEFIVCENEEYLNKLINKLF